MTPLVFNNDHLLFGTARPTFPAGAKGTLAVVYAAPLSVSQSGDGLLPIAIRNNTAQAVSHIKVTGSARKAGKLIKTGTSQEVQPAQLQPGQVGLSFIYYQSGKGLPTAASAYSFTFESKDADTSSYNTASLKVTEANRSGDSITGSATNATGKELQGPYKINVFCFGKSSTLQDVQGDFGDQDDNVPAGGKVTFTADLYGAKCSRFLVGATSYYA